MSDFDVVIVGSGVAGSMTGLLCAEYGFRTLIIEKRKIPRHKPCNGMLWPSAIEIIERYIGKLPRDIICTPQKYNGLKVVGKTGILEISSGITNVWRKNLDYWMSRKAIKAGAELIDSTNLVGMKEKDKEIIIEVKKDSKREKISTKFLIGADGDTSSVRRHLNPHLEEKLRFVLMRHYEGKISLKEDDDLCGINMNYFYFFPNPAFSLRYGFLQIKDGYVIIGTNHTDRSIVEAISNFERFLKKHYSFKPQKLMFSLGCYRTSLSFKEIKIGSKRIVLTGDAVLLRNAFNEGIGPSLLTAICAVKAIEESVNRGLPLVETYKTYLHMISGKILKSQEVGERIISEMRLSGKFDAEQFGKIAGYLLW